MTDIALSKEHALDLLHKLATDEAFRSSYEKSPVSALRSAGVSEALVLALSDDIAGPTKLLGKDKFQQAFQQVHDDLAEVCLCHRPPSVNLRQHVATKEDNRATSMPFAE